MNPILAALDVDTADAALAAATAVRGHVGGLKVGSHLFTAEGPGFVRALNHAQNEIAPPPKRGRGALPSRTTARR